MPFAKRLGLEITEARPEEVTGRLAWAGDLCTAQGVLHGGALMAFADTLGAICAFLNLPPNTTTATIESKTNFFRAVRGGHVEATSRLLHKGKTTIVVQSDLLDADQKAVAQVTQTQAVISTSDDS
ncbi:MAG: PaaI family thioesterase [Actinobacteria bacterium]|nr:PaaI family thioesterase [Actinomycetota bacterium]